MAGCYQTTGERANGGMGTDAPATPGGWTNGGFDESMTMLSGYARMVEFFTGMEYWKLVPAPDLAAGGTLVLAAPGERYVVYFRKGGAGGMKLAAGQYGTRWYDPRAGAWSEGPGLQQAAGKGAWMGEAPSGEGDWALVVEKR